jgi:hypothetical protein
VNRRTLLSTKTKEQYLRPEVASESRLGANRADAVLFIIVANFAKRLPSRFAIRMLSVIVKEPEEVPSGLPDDNYAGARHKLSERQQNHKSEDSNLCGGTLPCSYTTKVCPDRDRVFQEMSRVCAFAPKDIRLCPLSASPHQQGKENARPLRP